MSTSPMTEPTREEYPEPLPVKVIKLTPAEVQAMIVQARKRKYVAD